MDDVEVYSVVSEYLGRQPRESLHDAADRAVLRCKRQRRYVASRVLTIRRGEAWPVLRSIAYRIRRPQEARN